MIPISAKTQNNCESLLTPQTSLQMDANEFHHRYQSLIAANSQKTHFIQRGFRKLLLLSKGIAIFKDPAAHFDQDIKSAAIEGSKIKTQYRQKLVESDFVLEISNSHQSWFNFLAYLIEHDLIVQFMQNLDIYKIRFHIQIPGHINTSLELLALKKDNNEQRHQSIKDIILILKNNSYSPKRTYINSTIYAYEFFDHIYELLQTELNSLLYSRIIEEIGFSYYDVLAFSFLDEFNKLFMNSGYVFSPGLSQNTYFVKDELKRQNFPQSKESEFLLQKSIAALKFLKSSNKVYADNIKHSLQGTPSASSFSKLIFDIPQVQANLKISQPKTGPLYGLLNREEFSNFWEPIVQDTKIQKTLKRSFRPNAVNALNLGLSPQMNKIFNELERTNYYYDEAKNEWLPKIL